MPAANPLHRILLVSSSSGSQGGGELYLDGLAEGLRDLGHEVSSLLSAHPTMDALSESLSRWGAVARLPYRNTYSRRLRCVSAVYDRKAIERAARTFAQLRPTVLHLNKQNVEDGLDLLLAAQASGLPTVTTIHVTRSMTGLQSRGGWVRDHVARSTLSRVRCHYITVARTGAEQLIAFGRGAISPGRVYHVWNGVREIPPGDRARIRAEWGCDDSQLVLGCVARLNPQKAPLFLPPLLAALPENVHLAWVGDGELRDDFLRVADLAGVRHRVHCDGWRQDARQRLAGFDVFVLPSIYEGFPFALLEAMAAGLPCVASDVDGTREALVDGATGWLCPPGDRDAWLATLGSLVADRALREKAGAAGRSRYLEHFTLSAMARGTVEVYTQVLGAYAARTGLPPRSPV